MKTIHELNRDYMLGYLDRHYQESKTYKGLSVERLGFSKEELHELYFLVHEGVELNKNKAFSLIELVVVMVIMAILCTLTLPSLTKYMEAQKAQEAVKIIHHIKSAIEVCTIELNDCPKWSYKDQSGNDRGLTIPDPSDKDFIYTYSIDNAGYRIIATRKDHDTDKITYAKNGSIEAQGIYQGAV